MPTGTASQTGLPPDAAGATRRGLRRADAGRADQIGDAADETRADPRLPVNHRSPPQGRPGCGARRPVRLHRISMAIDCDHCNHVAACRRRYALSTLLSSMFLWIAHKRGDGADIGDARAHDRPSRCTAWSRTTRSPPAGTVPSTASTSRSTEGHFYSLLGPSGCGKTTTLRCVAGLERPDQGSISLGGVVVADGQRALPPEKRDIGMVFQSYAIWPHMTVFENAAFPLRVSSTKVGKDELRRRVDEVLGIVGSVRLRGPIGDPAVRWPAAATGPCAGARPAAQGAAAR